MCLRSWLGPLKTTSSRTELFKPDQALGGIALFDIQTSKVNRFASFDDKLTLDFKMVARRHGLLALYSQKDPDYYRGHRSGLFRREVSNSNPSLGIPIVTRP